MTLGVRRLGLGLAVAALLALGVLDLVQDYRADPATAYALSIFRALPLLFYRRWPLEAWLLELTAVVATTLMTVPFSPDAMWPWAVSSTAALVVLSALVAALGGRQLTITMLVVVLAVGLFLTVWPGRGTLGSTAGTAVMTALLCAIGAVVGDVVGARRTMAVALAEERRTSATERQLRTVVEERARIARELHDVVAHHMSMITVQAETARFRHEGLPDRVAAEFTELAQVARASLAELRGLLTALRDNAADPHRTPQPTLADLQSLVDRISASGTPTTMIPLPDTADLSQVLQLAVYRIVQEGLSNVVQHAPGAPTQVSVTRTPTTLRVEVINVPPPNRENTAVPDPGTGHGLIGLRERVTLLGGTFYLDQPNGGWRVQADLPL
jgi:signal transduction histidine kinase